ncbi:MAG: hypothetical protein ACKO9I_02755 [Sphaerospermopsis kisseleviana]|nr:hypothetical protein [Sphaerospermopsis sp. FACHB-1194]
MAQTLASCLVSCLPPQKDFFSKPYVLEIPHYPSQG